MHHEELLTGVASHHRFVEERKSLHGPDSLSCGPYVRKHDPCLPSQSVGLEGYHIKNFTKLGEDCVDGLLQVCNVQSL